MAYADGRRGRLWCGLLRAEHMAKERAAMPGHRLEVGHPISNFRVCSCFSL